MILPAVVIAEARPTRHSVQAGIEDAGMDLAPKTRGACRVCVRLSQSVSMRDAPRGLYMSIVAITAVAVVAVVVATAPSVAPALETPTSLDFGKVHQGTKHVKELTLTNPSDTPIEVIDLRTYCGCTTHPNLSFPASVSRDSPLAIPVTWHPGTSRGPTSTLITVRFRRLEESVETAKDRHVSVGGLVIPTHNVSPPQVEFREGESFKSVEVRRDDGARVELSIIDVDRNWLSATTLEGQPSTIVIELKRVPAVERECRASILVGTGDAVESQLAIPVYFSRVQERESNVIASN